jgi:hypothetical protein
MRGVASAESAILRDETALRLKLLVLSNAPIDEEAIVQRVNQLLREAGAQFDRKRCTTWSPFS